MDVFAYAMCKRLYRYYFSLSAVKKERKIENNQLIVCDCVENKQGAKC